MTYYSVATTLTRMKEDGATNVLTILVAVKARSIAEAKGLAVTEAMKEHPNHLVFTVLCIEHRDDYE